MPIELGNTRKFLAASLLVLSHVSPLLPHDVSGSWMKSHRCGGCGVVKEMDLLSLGKEERLVRDVPFVPASLLSSDYRWENHARRPPRASFFQTSIHYRAVYSCKDVTGYNWGSMTNCTPTNVLLSVLLDSVITLSEKTRENCPFAQPVKDRIMFRVCLKIFIKILRHENQLQLYLFIWFLFVIFAIFIRN